MTKKKKKPTVFIEAGKNATAIVGFPKKQIPEIAKKTIKRNLGK